MNDRVPELQRLLCEQWCADAEVVEDEAGLRVSLPMTEADGDVVTAWLQKTLGGWCISDRGLTLMRLSYDMDVDLLAEGQRAKVLDRIVREQGVKYQQGELSLAVREGDLGPALMRFGQAIVRVSDLKLWSWHRVSSTFYEDLAHELERIAGAQNVTRSYIVPDVADAANYPVDFAIRTQGLPFYIFGVPNVEKAKLTTIILLYLQRAVRFDSLVVPANLDDLPKGDRDRLVNAANDMVTGIDAVEPLERKVRLRLAAGS